MSVSKSIASECFRPNSLFCRLLLVIAFSSCALANSQTVFCEQSMIDPNASIEQVMNIAKKPSDKCKHAFIEVTRIFPDELASQRSIVTRFHHFEVPYPVWLMHLNESINRKETSAVIIRTGSRVAIRYRRGAEWFVSAGVVDTPSGHPTSELPDGVSVIDIVLQPYGEGLHRLYVFLKSDVKLDTKSLLAVFKKIVPISVNAHVYCRQDDVTYSAEGTNLWSTLTFSKLPSDEKELRKLPYLSISILEDQ